MDISQLSTPAIGLTTVHSRTIFGFNTACLLLATVAVALRIYARHLKKLSFVAEDYLIFLALLAFYAQGILMYCGIILGAAGHPQKEVSPKNVEASLRVLAGQGVCFGLEMTLSKWSICLLYKRIFAIRSFRIATYIIMSLIFGWGVLTSTVTWAWCVPVAYTWDVTIPGGHCANRDAGYLAVGVIDAVTDLFILILPLPMIYKLQIPRIKQISLAVIFSIAILCMIISALRAYFTTLVTFDDFTDSRTLLDIFSAIEPATSIMVASSLVLGPVLKHWGGRAGYFSQSKRSSPSPRSTQRAFQRINDSTVTDNIQDLQDIELGGTVTTVQAPARATLASLWHSDARMESGLEDTQSLAVQEGKGISVQRDFSVHEV